MCFNLKYICVYVYMCMYMYYIPARLGSLVAFALQLGDQYVQSQSPLLSPESKPTLSASMLTSLISTLSLPFSQTYNLAQITISTKNYILVSNKRNP